LKRNKTKRRSEVPPDVDDEPKPPRRFIKCPKCGASSKKLYSEMGGYQTRLCKNRHQFNYDKWIGDRVATIAIFTGNIADPYDR